jgi:hypothetical protein
MSPNYTNLYNKYSFAECVFFSFHIVLYTTRWNTSKYNYYICTDTRTVSKHTTYDLSCTQINMTLTKSHVTSVNQQLQSCDANILILHNTVTRTVRKQRATVLSSNHININLTRSHVQSVNA